MRFQSHVPRDHHIDLNKRNSGIFQSTCPARGRPLADTRIYQHWRISIHVPREGYDAQAIYCEGVEPDFNPRAREGTTSVSKKQSKPIGHFNPRAREGHDSVV